MKNRIVELLLGGGGLIVMLAPTGAALAAERIVCASGCYSTTIQGAIDASSDGDFVLVKDGTYRENILLNKKITVRSEKGAATTIIDGWNKTRGSNDASVVEITAAATLDGFTISNGTGKADVNGSRFGGGIYCLNASPHIRNCTISYNRTPGYGGGGGGIWIAGAGAAPTITNCAVRYNTASDAVPERTGGGGGIAISEYADPTISDCVISDNAAGYGGGIYVGYDSKGKILRSTISGNTANGFNTIGGGGIYCVGSSPDITNCVVSGNTANGFNLNGGGMAIAYFSSPAVTNCTIADNASTGAGGVYVIAASPAIKNSIILDGFVLNNAVVGVTYSNIQGGVSGTGNIDADPLFVSGNDFRLAPGSPCIDTGTNSGAPSDDRDGNPRPQGKSTDMGAYEYGASTRISITKGLYDYLSDKLDVSATTTLNLGSSKLYCNGVVMTLKSGVWSVSIPKTTSPPQRITVCAPGVNPIQCRTQE